MKNTHAILNITSISHHICQTREEDAIQKNRIALLKGLKKRYFSLENATTAQRDDRNIVLKAINQSAYNIKLASERLRDDEYVVYQAVKKQGSLLEYASERLQHNMKVVQAALASNPKALKFASNTMQDNDTLVFDAVSRNGKALLFASKRLQQKSELIKKSLESYPQMLEFFGSDMEEMVKIAIKEDTNNFKYASERIQQDKKFILNNQVAKNQYWHQELKRDKKFVLKVLKQMDDYIGNDFYQYLAPVLQNDQDVAMSCILANPNNFPLFNEVFRANFDIASIALKNRGGALEHVSDELKNNRHLVLLALKRGKYVLNYASQEIQKLLKNEENPYETLKKIIEIDEEKAKMESILNQSIQVSKKVKI